LKSQKKHGYSRKRKRPATVAALYFFAVLLGSCADGQALPLAFSSFYKSIIYFDRIKSIAVKKIQMGYYNTLPGGNRVLLVPEKKSP
jgi:hypothetical protein